MITGNQIREKFLTYFESKNHKRVESASLVPLNDPTLFFVNAGMVPFKDVFTGHEKRSSKKATSSQKCMRVSGKHNDLENVGRTPRHHTFFEMLGNFSFGDYFKKEAIEYAWEFLTEVVQIPPEPLWITIFNDDDEAFEIWHKHIGIPPDKIIRCGEKDNFWSMGPTGPCGPCSEIHIDQKLFHEGIKAQGNPATNENDFMEIWNLVFMQFNRDESGKMELLPKPSIDTGMGLERLAAVLQKKKSNYDTDLFQPLIQAVAKSVSKTYGRCVDDDVSMRVIADHIRAQAFLISDGVQPSNEGRGYVLRRIMRRAIRHGKMLGQNKPFMHRLIKILVGEMGGAYGDLQKNQSFITKVIKTEEENFLETLDRGLRMIEEEVAAHKSKQEKVFDGTVAFKLYDTFGFPVDLTELIANDSGLHVAMDVFEAEMEKQKKRARLAWKGSGQEKVDALYHQLVNQKKTTQFVGYDTLESQANIEALIVKGTFVDQASLGELVQVFVGKTPFYGESGGQTGDKGQMAGESSVIEINDTQKPLDGVISHYGKVIKGPVCVGDKVQLRIAESSRKSTMQNHTATHILHAALRKTLGDHVKQAGSLVESDRLRFDFSHFEALSSEQIEEIEKKVNRVIQANYPVVKQEMSHKEAIKKGALAFFGDKYGDHVRVISIGPYSTELCGGTHLNASGEIGAFKILSEQSVASGVRRIEAITGMTVIGMLQELRQSQEKLTSILQAPPSEFPDKIKKFQKQIKELEREIAQLKTKIALGGGGGADYLDGVKEIKGVRLLAFETELDDIKALRDFSDQVKTRLKSGIVVIGSKIDGKISLIITVSKDLTDKYHAGQLIQKIAPLVGGKGGGRPDMAQAGGPLVEGLGEALKKVEELL